ncbi:unnamed protein product [Coffea canephora]|uniref:NAD-dependent epimerase/dehydratase domain-containing protein n=1 Tax=Coffea canephora TaxID=49390 RepID=A0A068V8E7_COFCA|nr:unnamed protein product [Coffea canephora]
MKGTLNVLQSFTCNDELKDGVIVDESWFSDPLYCEEHKVFLVSTILAENAAWDFSKEHGIDMIAINPRMVIGPFLQPSATLNAEVILSLVNGMKFPIIIITRGKSIHLCCLCISGIYIPRFKSLVKNLHLYLSIY